MRQTSFIPIAFLIFITCSVRGQTEVQIQNLIIDKSGQISWTTTNEKSNTQFEIEEWRWNKWLLLGQLNGKGAGNNLYSFLADTSCGLYQIRVTAKDTVAHHTPTINSPVQKEVKLLTSKVSKDKPFLRFDKKTKYEIYDQYGNKLLFGCDSQVDTSTFQVGLYFIEYGNKVEEFKRETR